jgi:potassium-transporting ATPase KdpC subunit
MRKELVTSLLAVAVLTVVLGVAYPLAVTGVSQVAFGGKADGSKVTADGRTVGSRLIGQRFPGPRWFHPRPSATGYSADATAFSNAGPNAVATRDAIAANAGHYLAVEGPYNPALSRAGIPPDAVQTSASGVDPHISLANARIQAARVARVRGLTLSRVNALIDDATEGRGLGVFGEPGVNVLELNLAIAMEARR